MMKDFEQKFIEFCVNGDIEGAINHREHYKCSLNDYSYKHAFIHSCVSGNIEAAKWLLELYSLMLFPCVINVFYKCCGSGTLVTVKWSYEIIMEAHIKYIRDIEYWTESGRPDLADFMRSSILDIAGLREKGINTCDVNGYPEIAEWLRNHSL